MNRTIITIIMTNKPSSGCAFHRMDCLCVILCACLPLFVLGDPTPHIAGGLPITIEEFPSVVSIHEFHESNGTFSKHCGGAILTSYYVLTTAKCVTGRPLQVRAGSSFSSSEGSVHEVVTSIIHPNYTDGADIAVLGLGNPIFLNNSAVGQAPLPFQDMEPNIGMTSYIVGWSSDSLATEPSESLQYGIVSITPREQCASAHAALPTPDLTHTQLCAFSPGVDFCIGGTGSPLFSAGVVIGLAAYTVDCGVTSVPSVYTQTSRFTNWILSTASGQPTI